jgi:hypothetical protein
MWYRVLFLRSPLNTEKVVFVKSTRRHRVPTWTYALRRPHKTYDAVPASKFMRLKGAVKSLLKKVNLWLSEDEFIVIIEEALRLNYRDPKRIKDILGSIEEWMKEPIRVAIRVEVGVRGYPYVIRWVPDFITSNARDSVRLWYDTYVYVYSKTVHVCRGRCVVFSLSNNEPRYCDELVESVERTVSYLEELPRYELSEALADALRALKQYLVLCALAS